MQERVKVEVLQSTGIVEAKTKVVEILFARGLVKVLFATETFAMVGGQRYC